MDMKNSFADQKQRQQSRSLARLKITLLVLVNSPNILIDDFKNPINPGISRPKKKLQRGWNIM